MTTVCACWLPGVLGLVALKAPVAQLVHAVGKPGGLRIVSGEQDGQLPLAAVLTQKP